MNKFVVEVYTGDKWEPRAVWLNAVNFRAALRRLNKQCENMKVSMDTHRLRRINNSEEELDIQLEIKSNKERQHGK